MKRRVIQLKEPKQVSISCFGGQNSVFHKFEFSFENLLLEMQGLYCVGNIDNDRLMVLTVE